VVLSSLRRRLYRGRRAGAVAIATGQSPTSRRRLGSCRAARADHRRPSGSRSGRCRHRLRTNDCHRAPSMQDAAQTYRAQHEAVEPAVSS
jgi:hypothetical protein